MEKKLEFHPVADLFPLMPDAELKSLADDIARNGLKSKVVLLDGMVLDGRNRVRACELVDREFKTVDYKGGSPVEFVLSLNLHRRHMSESQREMVAARLANLGEGRPAKTAGAPAVSQAEAASGLKVTRHGVQRAKRLLETGDKELIAKVDAGEMKVTAAMGFHRRKKQRAKLEAVTEFKGRYRVLYADPPWRYDKVVEGYGAASMHYECMSLEDICNLTDEGGRRVQDIAQDDAVIFLWCTAPLLPLGLELLAAWGFTYKENFIWDKMAHNCGSWISVRHEHLLIGERGRCPKDSSKLIPSVQSIKPGEHSVKPEEFRAIVDSMYVRPPNLPEGQNDRIELFARARAPGWDCFGLEVA